MGTRIDATSGNTRVVDGTTADTRGPTQTWTKNLDTHASKWGRRIWTRTQASGGVRHRLSAERTTPPGHKSAIPLLHAHRRIWTRTKVVLSTRPVPPTRNVDEESGHARKQVVVSAIG
jgi:hypothetical protein